MKTYTDFDANLKLSVGGAIGVAMPFRDVFRLCVTQANAPRPFPSYAIVKDAQHIDAERKVSGRRCTIKTDKYVLDVNTGNDKQGFKLCDKNGRVRFDCTGKNPFKYNGEKIALRFLLDPGQQVYGIGEWGECLARIPGHYTCWNTDDSYHQPLKRPYCCIPTMMFSSGDRNGWVMMFVNNPGMVEIDLGLEEIGVATIAIDTGDLDMWFICGDSPEELMQKWTDLTGRCKRPPLWSLGFHQCRWSYMSQKEVLSIVDTFKKKVIPIDAIWLDIDYMQDYRVFTWNAKTFPKPAEMCAALRKKHVRLVTILDPGVKIEKGDLAYDTGIKDNVFIRHADGRLVDTVVWPGHVHHPDFSLPATRKWWGQMIAQQIVKNGVSGLWNDMNEPACFGDGPDCKQFPLDSINYDGGEYRTHKSLHNVYGLNMVRASQEALEKCKPNERPFVLSRSGWAGVQRYAAIWTGDNRSCFSSMPYDLVQVLSLGMSGVPFAGADIGGFIGNASPELMVRWMEHGIFLPFCRAHTQTKTLRHEPWSFGKNAERLLKSLLELRYQLLPYLQDAFVQAQQTGRPVVRPLVYDYPEDRKVRTIGNEFMFGNSILVAPVLEAGIDCRSVYLPAGQWYHWWTGRVYSGNVWVSVDAPLGRPPVFVKAGSVIPMGNVIQSTDEKSDTLYYNIFPVIGGKVESVYCEDDGKTFDYLKGVQASRTVSVEAHKSGKKVILSIGHLTGKWRPTRKYVGVRVCNGLLAIKAATIDKKPARVQNGVIRFAENGKPHIVKVQL